MHSSLTYYLAACMLTPFQSRLQYLANASILNLIVNCTRSSALSACPIVSIAYPSTYSIFRVLSSLLSYIDWSGKLEIILKFHPSILESIFQSNQKTYPKQVRTHIPSKIETPPSLKQNELSKYGRKLQITLCCSWGIPSKRGAG